MGQYFYLVNLDKHEFVHPHKLGDGLKLWEQAASSQGMGAAAIMLLACSNGRGGGDFRADDHGKVYGRWAGDHIAWVGDYAEDTDLPPEFEAGSIYRLCNEREFCDISDLIAQLLEEEFEFLNSRWRRVKEAQCRTK
jgi:hypothetical protein